MTLKFDYLVIGAGVAGLAFAHEVARNGKSVLVLEKADQVGGLSRTLEYKGFRFDYCAHRFHTANPRLLESVKALVGPTFHRHTKKSRIFMFGKYLKYPFELQNLLRAMPPTSALHSAVSFGLNMIVRTARALVRGRRAPLRFRSYEDWFVHFFGRKLYTIMCYPYTRKIWKRDPSEISADWADQRFEGVKLRRLLRKIITKILTLDFTSYSLEDESLAPDGGDFYYGELGAQEIPDSYARGLAELQASILTGVTVQAIDDEAKEVRFTHNGKSATATVTEKIVSTIPLHGCYRLLGRKDGAIADLLAEVKYMDIVFVYLLLNRDSVSNDHWLYFPDENIIFNRAVEFKNWSEKMCPPGQTALCLDITCFEGDSTWSMSDAELVESCIESASSLAGLIERGDVFDTLVVRVKDAYPFYDLAYREKLQAIVGHLQGAGNLLCLGRTGIFKYNNSDGSIEMGVELAARLLRGEPSPSVLDYASEEVSY